MSLLYQALGIQIRGSEDVWCHIHLWVVEDWEDPSSDSSSTGLDKGDAYSDVGAVVSAPAPKSHF